mmetsp:Transcript_5593/g.9069  ORF Transcript_5593/g.9069 Transcript_5593/m.9069 type:complete len:509 (+) Transcript_5593:87-1613(+)
MASMNIDNEDADVVVDDFDLIPEHQDKDVPVDDSKQFVKSLVRDADKANVLLDASDPQVLEKYKTAGVIANRALHHVLMACKPGMKIVDLCRMGDAFMSEECAKVHLDIKGKGQKGICFPTCVSVNEVAGHNSPFSDDKRTLHHDDMVKVDMGAHIDGFCAVVAHTIVLGACEGKKANVIAAGWSAAQSALRLLKAGHTNSQVTIAIEKSASTFACDPMDSVLSHEMRQYVIDHDNTIICKQSEERKVAEFTFADYQVFGIDVMITSGRGKAVDRGERCTIYKRNVEVEYPLKMKTSREFLKVINKQHPTFPFTMRNFEENRSRMGVIECVRMNMVQPYPILSERQGEYVAQFKFTAIVSPKGTIQITGLPLDMAAVHPSAQVHDSALTDLLSAKFEGALPGFYEVVNLPKFEPNTTSEEKSEQEKTKVNKTQKKNDNKNANKKSNKPRYRDPKNSNKNKGKNQKNKPKQQQSNKKKNPPKTNKSNANAAQSQPRPQQQQERPTMDLD